MKYDDIIKKTSLFKNIPDESLDELLRCMNVSEKIFKKDEFIFNAGDAADTVGIVLSGCIYIIHEDYWGNRNILTTIKKGGLFGEAFSFSSVSSLPVSAYAHEDSSLLLIDCKKIFTTCPSSCSFHVQLIKNMLEILAVKNLHLTQKIQYLTQKSTRNKVLLYLSDYAVNSGKNTFEIPFNRQELADYLSVDRSALSNILCKMRDEGIIDFSRNEFKILK